MNQLGSIHIADATAIPHMRRKVFRALEELVGDAISATRIAATLSTAARRFLAADVPVLLQMQVKDAGGSVMLHFEFSSPRTLPDVPELRTVCSNVHRRNTQEGTDSLTLETGIKLSASAVNLKKDKVLEILTEKSRDELMAEVQTKNQELEESLERLRTTTSAKELMESELHIATDIQMSMLPLEFPAFPDRAEFDIHATLHPAREVGGDLYDFYFLDEDHLCFVVGDVSGKGVPAALFMAVTKTLIKSRAANDRSPSSILTHVSNELAQNNDTSMFVTMLLAILNVKTGEFTYSNAGHNPPYILRRGGELERLAELHGAVLGAMEGMVYKEAEAKLHADDGILLYTDGLTEAMDTERNLFSEERLVTLLESSTAKTAQELVTELVDAVHEFETGAMQADDITVLMLWFAGYHGEIPKLDLVLKNKLEEIDRCNNEFSSYAQAHGIPSSVQQQVSLVLDELLNNTISYGYSGNQEKDKRIQVQFELTGKRLSITISDDGIPFNPFSIQEPDTKLALEDRSIGGLGIHLVKNLMDEYAYARRIGTNVVTLKKRLPDE
ncbi:MAG: serine/threonine protein phosphatase [Ignavibacteria bacterium]|nr:MAG: serine/threonine protein phosphatase [Ignavibacteria bacterium]